ncbi:hypothetical protein [Pseudoxanthomonas sp. PXM01]|uniref:hypothetical protein n=1 Tax=Pseudoxanthomonas sp. PXM01 TaxID=2769295 RepID=UPI001784F38D|nr:hypothetical protein [Pseudoxanthomonas sp. PXM01]MBD9468593.1 hypothetical protein [Pseudoxanthomonas sp. PXM01]
MRLTRFLLPAVLALSCTACMSIYRMPAGTPSASLRVPPGATTWICADGPAQILPREKDGRARIPAGQRITVGANFSSSDGYMNYFCSAGVSLLPDQDARYYQDFETEGNMCSALVYRETDDTRVGLAFEPTMGRSGPGCTR